MINHLAFSIGKLKEPVLLRIVESSIDLEMLEDNDDASLGDSSDSNDFVHDSSIPNLTCNSQIGPNSLKSVQNLSLTYSLRSTLLLPPDSLKRIPPNVINSTHVDSFAIIPINTETRPAENGLTFVTL